jgi:hypothetical protein
VLPYRRTEQSGVAALADAFHVPVLASTVGGLEELYGDSPWTFPPRSPHAIAQVLSDFLAVSAKGRVTSSIHHPTAALTSVVNKTLDVYRSIAAQPTPHHQGSPTQGESHSRRQPSGMLSSRTTSAGRPTASSLRWNLPSHNRTSHSYGMIQTGLLYDL